MRLPPEFKMYFRDPGTKAAWISVYEGPNMTRCDNCNGSGFFVATIAIGGPFEEPPIKGVAHWANDKWWNVENKVATCPVCKGVRQGERHYIRREAAVAVDELAQKFECLTS